MQLVGGPNRPPRSTRAIAAEPLAILCRVLSSTGMVQRILSPIVNGPAIGFLETSSIARGIEATDAMMKKRT